MQIEQHWLHGFNPLKQNYFLLLTFVSRLARVVMSVNRHGPVEKLWKKDFRLWDFCVFFQVIPLNLKCFFLIETILVLAS